MAPNSSPRPRICALCHVTLLSLLLKRQTLCPSSSTLNLAVTYFGQWHVSRRDETKGLRSSRMRGLALCASATGLRRLRPSSLHSQEKDDRRTSTHGLVRKNYCCFKPLSLELFVTWHYFILYFLSIANDPGSKNKAFIFLLSLRGLCEKEKTQREREELSHVLEGRGARVRERTEGTGLGLFPSMALREEAAV